MPWRVIYRGGIRDSDGSFDFTEHTCNLGSINEDELRYRRDRMLHKVVESDGEIEIEFSKLYRRKRQFLIAELTSLQETAYRAVMELADRLEQENQIGPYNPLTVELMTNLAREHEELAPGYVDPFTTFDQRVLCNYCATPTTDAGYCNECHQMYGREERVKYRRIRKSKNEIAKAMAMPTTAMPTPLPVRIEHDPFQRSYYIRLDSDGRHRTHEEMMRDATEGLVKAMQGHQQEFASELLPKK